MLRKLVRMKLTSNDHAADNAMMTTNMTYKSVCIKVYQLDSLTLS